MAKSDGDIKNRTHAKRLVIFKGLRQNNMQPSDFDMFYQEDPDIFVLGELKHIRNTKVAYAQFRAMNTLSEVLHKSEQNVLFIIGKHKGETGDIYPEKAIVEKYKAFNTWRPGKGRTVKVVYDGWLKKVRKPKKQANG